MELNLRIANFPISSMPDLEKLLENDVFLVHVSSQKYKWLTPEDKHDYFIFFTPEEAVDFARQNPSMKDNVHIKSPVIKTRYIFKSGKREDSFAPQSRFGQAYYLSRLRDMSSNSAVPSLILECGDITFIDYD